MFNNLPEVVKFLRDEAIHHGLEKFDQAADFLKRLHALQVSSVEQSKTETRRLHEQVEQLTTQLQESRDRVALIEAFDKSQLVDKVTACEYVIDRHRDELLEANAEIGRLRNLAQPVDHRIQELQNSLVSLQSHNAVVEANNAELAASVRELRARYEAALPFPKKITLEQWNGLNWMMRDFTNRQRATITAEEVNAYRQGVREAVDFLFVDSGVESIATEATFATGEGGNTEHVIAVDSTKTVEELAADIGAAPVMSINEAIASAHEAPGADMQTNERTIAQIIRSSRAQFNAGNTQGHPDAESLGAANVMRYLFSVVSIIQNAPQL